MPTLLVDAIGANSGHIPVTAPKVGAYTTGNGIMWDAGQIDRFKGHSGLVLIDQAANDGLAGGANVKDSETGAATIAEVVATAKRFGPKAFSTYIQKSNIDACRSALADEHLEGMTYWMADWNLTQAQATELLVGDIMAVQFASPSSNPNTILPGTNLTLREANVDLSITRDAWHAAPARKPSGELRAELTFNLATGRWTLKPLAGEGKIVWGREAWASAEVQIDTGGKQVGHWRVKPMAWNAKPLG